MGRQVRYAVADLEAFAGGTPATRPRQRTEICRSFAYKLNTGNFESRDFFMSQKSECDASDAEAVSAALYAFCKSQVLLAVKQYRDENFVKGKGE